MFLLVRIPSDTQHPYMVKFLSHPRDSPFLLMLALMGLPTVIGET